MTPLVLGVDPGFAAFGWALARLAATHEEVVRLGVVRTAPDTRKRRTLAADDHHRRTQELHTALTALFADHHIVACAAEAASLPRNASASHKVGLAWGCLSSVLTHHNIPLVQASPQAIKKALCGQASASKADVQARLEARYPEQFERFKTEYPVGQWEHGFDACSAVVACLGADVLQMARRMARQGVAA